MELENIGLDYSYKNMSRALSFFWFEIRRPLTIANIRYMLKYNYTFCLSRKDDERLQINQNILDAVTGESCTGIPIALPDPRI